MPEHVYIVQVHFHGGASHSIEGVFTSLALAKQAIELRQMCADDHWRPVYCILQQKING